MSSPMSVLCIQKKCSSVAAKTKIIPRSCGRSRRNIKPRVRASSLFAISTRTTHGPRGVSNRTAPSGSVVETTGAAWV